MTSSLALVRTSLPTWVSLVTTSMGNCLCAFDEVNVQGRRFQVREKIGEGGFSTIDLVQDRSNRKYYVLKRIACHGKEDEITALREVQYHEEFNSSTCDNVIKMECHTVKNVRESAKTSISSHVWLVLPFYRRGNLQSEIDFLKSSSSFIDEGRVLRLFHGICHALSVVHAAQPEVTLNGGVTNDLTSEINGVTYSMHSDHGGVAHRDVKPANVLLTDDDVPVLMDFGSCAPARLEIRSAREAMALQDLAAERCSMPYRAPELFNVDSLCTIDERTDIWSLGCLLYALCFLEGPFDKAYQRGDSIALASIAGKVKFPDSPSYSVGIVGLITQMMNVVPSERPFIYDIITTVNKLQQEMEKKV